MSLKDRALLVSLTVAKPKMTEKDKSATMEVALDKGASMAAVAVVKKLYPKQLLAPITEVESQARRYVESVTQPWCRGMALLPAALFMDFQQKIGAYKLAFEQAVTVFLNNYSTVLAQASTEQGTLFNASEYPDFSSLKADFSFRVMYTPLADAGGIVLELEADVLAGLRKEVREQTQSALARGQKQMRERLSDAIQRIATQCGKEDGRIYDSLTGNLEELLKVLPHLNLMDDPDFDALCDRARELIVSPIAIRTIPEVRQSVAREADAILKQMEGMM